VASTLKRVGTGLLIAGISSAAVIAVLVATNPAPRVPVVSDADAATARGPYVVKLHAQWCPLCMMTRGVWSEIEKTYAGRVRFVVFDFTSDATTARTEAEARRLGLGGIFDEYVGETGTILVLDGSSKEVIGDLHGERAFEPYRTAIDLALQSTADPKIRSND
jgi:thiol-disulfide isomerase/thioredoxin